MQIHSFYLIYSGIWLHYRLHLLEKFTSHSTPDPFLQLELNQYPSRHTGPALENGSQAETPGVEIALYHIINLTHFTLLITALTRAWRCSWQGNMLRQTFSRRLSAHSETGVLKDQTDFVVWWYVSHTSAAPTAVKRFCQQASGWVAVGVCD